jgi:tetratricopeptide (TPR) repeat protein
MSQRPFRRDLRVRTMALDEDRSVIASPNTSNPVTYTNLVKKHKKSMNLYSSDSPISTPCPISQLLPDSLSLLSIKPLNNSPLSEVKSLTPNEISPEECKRSENPSVNYFFERAFASSKNNEFQTAIKLYKKVLACDSNHFESWINIGICMMKLGMHPEAISSFESAIKANKTSFIPYYNKALDFISVHDYTSALKCMDAAILIFPNAPEELQRIRTYAIFKSGKVSLALSNTKDTTQKVLTENHSPTPQPVYPKPKLEVRASTMQIERSLEPKKTYLQSRKSKFNQIQDFDTRDIRTALSVPPKKIDTESYSSTKKSTRKSSNSYNWKKFQFKEFFKPSQKLPVSISEMEVQEPKTKDPILVKKIQDKLSQSEDKLIEYIIKKIEKSFSKPRVINKSQLTDQEIKVVGSFLSPDQEIDYDQVDKIFKNTDFFCDVSEDYRKKIYDIASLSYFDKNSRIFTQGNYAKTYYVLLKGRLESVVDREKSAIQSTHEYVKYSNSLRSNRVNVISVEHGASCIALEDSYMLEFPIKEYQVILSDLLKKEIEERVCFMITLPLFKGLDPVSLIQLAWHLEKETYSEDQELVKKNEIPKGLMILYSGYCGIYTTGPVPISTEGSEFANIKIRKSKPRSFYTGNLKTPIPKRIKTRSSQLRYYQNSLLTGIKTSKNEYYKKDKIEYGLLQKGDYFGGRVVMDYNFSDTKSKFSVIAESKIVDVLIMKKAAMQYLPEKIAAQVKAAIQKTSDVDCPPEVDADDMDTEFNEWQRYKHDIVDYIQRNKFVETKKIQFPYIR